MRVKLEWLNELVDLTGLSVKDIVDKVSLYSIEVENLEKLVDASNLVIGHVLTKTPHPDSDHLNVLTVDVGKETLQIVCGAPNVEAGQYVIVALVGAILPGGEIKASKIRGVESFGMCCSLAELGIEAKFIPEKYAHGIYYFEDEITPGTDALKALNMDDYVIELGITPNRGDLLSMIGVAYELSAAFNRPLKQLTYDYKRSNLMDKDLEVRIEADACKSYYAQVIRDVHIKPSPLWLKARLIAFGVRPINNVVDITNYILALFGQPLHSFDYDVLGNKIVVRYAKQGETITTLDDIERKLEPTDLLITDGLKGVALAGVMGGANSDIKDTTKNVLIEAAIFDPMTVRKTAARLNLHSESSMRFERGVDLNRTKLALDYTNYLFTTLADAKVDKEWVHAGISELADTVVNLTSYNVNHLLGTNIETKQIVKILDDLRFKVEVNGEKLKVYVPSRRPDITIMQDIVEEVGRLYGYENLPATTPTDSLVGGLNNMQANEAKIKDTLSGLGLFETVTYSLVNEAQNKQFTYNHLDLDNIKLLMPLTEDRSVLRKSLVPSLVDVCKYNVSRKCKDYAAFEIGKVYFDNTKNETDSYLEEYRLAGIMSGTFSSTLHSAKLEKVDFYLVKGIIDFLFAKFDLKLEYKPIDKEVTELHPKRSATVLYNGEPIGFIGQLHPKYARDNGLDETYVYELKIDWLLDYVEPIRKYTPINKLPSVERDLALVVKKNVLASDIIASIRKSEKELLSDVKVFDVYVGEKVASDEKSVALKLVFTSQSQLTDEIINEKIKKILKDLSFRVGAKLREI